MTHRLLEDPSHRGATTADALDDLGLVVGSRHSKVTSPVDFEEGRVRGLEVLTTTCEDRRPSSCVLAFLNHGAGMARLETQRRVDGEDDHKSGHSDQNCLRHGLLNGTELNSKW